MNDWFIRHILRINPELPMTTNQFKRALACYLGIPLLVVAVIVACAPAASEQRTAAQAAGWRDLGGQLSARDIDTHTTYYAIGGSLSCVYHP